MKHASGLLLSFLFTQFLLTATGCYTQPPYPEPGQQFDAHDAAIDSVFQSVSPGEGPDGLRRFEIFMEDYLELHDNDERVQAYLLYYSGYLNGLFQQYPQALENFLAAHELANQHMLRSLAVRITAKLPYANNILSAGLDMDSLVAQAIEMADIPPAAPYTQHLALYAKGAALYYEQAYTASIEVLLPLAAYFGEHGHIIEEIDTNNYLALASQRAGRFEDAFVYLSRNHQIHQVSGDPIAISRTRSNIAILHGLSGNYKAAIDSTKVSIAFNDSLGRSFAAVQNIFNIGIYYRNINQFEASAAYFRDGLARSEALDFTQGILFNSLGLAATLIAADSDDLNEIRALLYMFKQHIEKPEETELYRDFTSSMFNLELRSGNTAEALRWHAIFLETLENFFDLERQAAINEILTENRLLQSQAQILHLNQTILLKEQAQRNLYAGLIFLFLLLAGAGGANWHFSRLSRRIAQAHAVLQSQNQEIATQNELLLKLSEERQRLIKIIIHDLRNPITSLNGSLELMKEDVSQFQEPVIEIAMHSVSRMRTIVNGLLELFKSESADISNELQQFSPADLLNRVIKDFGAEANHKQQEIVAELQDFETVSHKESLQTIAGNLVSNAIKYAPPETRILVSLKCAGNGWQLKVRDQGPGFSETDKEKMFTLFGRLSGKPTGNEESTGIGLYAVKTTIEKLGGSISLNRDYTEGAEFVCRFPYLKSNNDSKAKPVTT
ncbi:MAG: tetratricopeptide repeat-containing sensor histidine kinase [Balneolales bacterium]|nr:tetratricopeptide repeat-containing sensor histidine kinase [Balneolales bacterium]